MGVVKEFVGVGRPRTKVALVLLVAAAYTPLGIYAGNLDKFPHRERLFVIVASLWLAGVVFHWILSRFVIAFWAVLCSATVFTLLLGSAGELSLRFSTSLALICVVAVSISAAFVLRRFDGDFQRYVVLSLVAFLGLGPILALLSSERSSDGVIGIESATAAIPGELASKPDVYVILLDSFPGEVALDEVYEYEVSWPVDPGVNRLNGWAAYPVTLASVTSLFEMGYPLEDRAILDTDTRDALSDYVAGNNRFTRFLSSEGYQILHVESGWSRSYCAAIVDRCVQSPFLDEGIFEVVRQSVLGRWVSESLGSGMTVGAEGAMTWLRDNLPELASNGSPEFVFASVILPHPPLMLNAECVVVFEGWRGGNSLYTVSEATSARTSAFLEQVECAADFEAGLLDAIPDDAVVIFLSDHGGDSGGQLSIPDFEWSDSDVVERMNIHLSVQGLEACEFREPMMAPEILRYVLWCLAGHPAPSSNDVPQIFVANRIDEPKILGLIELDEVDMADLSVGG